MICKSNLDELVDSLTIERFKKFEQDIFRAQDLAAPNTASEKRRDKLRREFITSIGIDTKKFDKAVEADNRKQEAELDAFVKEHRPTSANRPAQASPSRLGAAQAAVLAEAGHIILPVHSASVFAADRGKLADVVGVAPDDWNPGPINSGWVNPVDPSRVRIHDGEHDLSLCWPNDYIPSPKFTFEFAFIPATTGTYEMTAIIGFHGFYVLVADDSWWNCRFARVKLTARTKVHQYVDTAWKDYPALIDIEKSNANEVTNYDHTGFFDNTAALRAGDPVVFTVEGTVYGFSHGGGTRAELNFADGTANYIEPLFLSVIKL